MRLLSIDLYEETPNRGRHDLLKFHGTVLDFRYMRRMMSRLMETCPIEHTLDPYRNRPRLIMKNSWSETELKAAQERLQKEMDDFLFHQEHFFILRVYHDGRIFNDPMVRDARDRLMLLKLAS